jgi:hypothetical protein
MERKSGLEQKADLVKRKLAVAFDVLKRISSLSPKTNLTLALHIIEGDEVTLKAMRVLVRRVDLAKRKISFFVNRFVRVLGPASETAKKRKETIQRN